MSENKRVEQMQTIQKPIPRSLPGGASSPSWSGLVFFFDIQNDY